MSQVASSELELRRLLSRLYWHGVIDGDLGRELHIALMFAQYSRLTSMLISVNGSPPKGTLLVMFDSIPTHVDHVVFVARGKARTIARDSDDFHTVWRFVAALDPPSMDPAVGRREPG